MYSGPKIWSNVRQFQRRTSSHYDIYRMPYDELVYDSPILVHACARDFAIS